MTLRAKVVIGIVVFLVLWVAYSAFDYYAAEWQHRPSRVRQGETE